jgi:hypothetical protein
MTEHVITLRIANEPFSAIWSVARNQLVVASAYGDIRTVLRDPATDTEALARRLFRELVHDWLEGPEVTGH